MGIGKTELAHAIAEDELNAPELATPQHVVKSDAQRNEIPAVEITVAALKLHIWPAPFLDFHYHNDFATRTSGPGVNFHLFEKAGLHEPGPATLDVGGGDAIAEAEGEVAVDDLRPGFLAAQQVDALDLESRGGCGTLRASRAICCQ
ncbi:MAG: hypothetical protein Q9P14_08135 [candidate division KSB1 bacterium]|nr:hypothetical protein [candidate division KSB1 bacterium]